MYSSLKAWCKIPIKHVRSDMYLPNGEPNIVAAVTLYAYIANDMTNIIDREGHETLSSAQVYFADNPVITLNDQIILPDNIAYTIKNIKDFYDGNTGLVDVKVVYL